MKRLAVFMTVSLLLATQIGLVNGETFSDDDVSIDLEKTNVELKPDEIKSLNLTLKNKNDRSLQFDVSYTSTECKGLTYGGFSKDGLGVNPNVSFVLKPGETKNLTLYLEGSENAPDCEGAEDGTVSAEWTLNNSDEMLGSKTFPIDVKKFSDDGVSIDLEKTNVELKPGEIKSLNLTLKNKNCSTLQLDIVYGWADCIGCTAGGFSKDEFGSNSKVSFVLKPGETKNLTLYLEGSENAPDCEGAEDGYVRAEWTFNNSDEELGVKTVGIDVEKTNHFPSDNLFIMMILVGVIGVVVVGGGIYWYKNTKE
ncbi:MAG: hypothetical protein KGY76_01530 [Candidatus Thermoplasmatota archaeon]|nr:hypothetical protein [Candidatus Thermoplasmatota archaeon]